MRCKCKDEIEQDLTNTKKNSLLKHWFQLYPYFPEFFSKSGKLLGKFQDFFKNSRLCTNPGNTHICIQTPRFKCWLKSGLVLMFFRVEAYVTLVLIHNQLLRFI